ncbi:DUF3566 domain-containing protein [Bifidobacterium saguinibicoloris]|uniref:DUF3566 domain-containing protein n=1 Tax=Bifidobacterium saguinibicoloris TaxID=2834433 RepID=UPI001C57B7AB|nr:DUF3566 domain-containing protein [Bifidobacterium saguinibicoloris]MBW3081364.1 DUF3566 domain-containing protein [Bifidobacterium saguinibicoloris]
MNNEEQHEENAPEVSLPERPEPVAPVESAAPAAEENGERRAPRVARSVSNAPLAGDSRTHVHESDEKVGSGVPVRPAKRRGTPRARRMNLSLTRLNVWSVAKVAFMMSIAGAIIEIVAAALVWVLLNAVGVFGQMTDIVSSTGLDAGGFDMASIFSLPTVLSVVTILAIVGVVLFTLLAVIIAAIYNVVSALVGGIHITLGDD